MILPVLRTRPALILRGFTSCHEAQQTTVGRGARAEKAYPSYFLTQMFLCGIRCPHRETRKDILTEPTPWSWAILEKPPVVQLLKNIPTFYGTRRFITVFTRALHWSLS
jgi:hypothetical protein